MKVQQKKKVIMLDIKFKSSINGVSNRRNGQSWGCCGHHRHKRVDPQPEELSEGNFIRISEESAWIKRMRLSQGK